jgi:hypothetical protein
MKNGGLRSSWVWKMPRKKCRLWVSIYIILHFLKSCSTFQIVGLYLFAFSVADYQIDAKDGS